VEFLGEKKQMDLEFILMLASIAFLLFGMPAIGRLLQKRDIRREERKRRMTAVINGRDTL
jgi:hypothetical protein